MLGMSSYFLFRSKFLQVDETIANVIKCSKLVRDDTHMTSMKIVQFSRPPTPLVRLPPKFFHPLDLGRPISNESPFFLSK